MPLLTLTLIRVNSCHHVRIVTGHHELLTFIFRNTQRLLMYFDHLLNSFCILNGSCSFLLLLRKVVSMVHSCKICSLWYCLSYWLYIFHLYYPKLKLDLKLESIFNQYKLFTFLCLFELVIIIMWALCVSSLIYLILAYTFFEYIFYTTLFTCILNILSESSCNIFHETISFTIQISTVLSWFRNF